MEPATFYLRAIPIADAMMGVLRVVDDIAPDVQGQLVVTTNVLSPHFRPGARKAKEMLAAPDVKAFHDYLVARTQIEGRVARIALGAEGDVTYESKDGLIAELRVKPPNNIAEPQAIEFLTKAADACAKHFNVTSRPAIIGAALPAQQQESLRFQERAVADLATQVSKLGHIATEQIARAQEIINDKIAELERTHEARRAALEGIHQQRLQELSSREAGIAEKEKEFDIKARLAARRDLLTKMQSKIDAQSTETVSRAVERKRTWVHVTCIIAAFAAGATVYLLLRNGEPSGYLLWLVGVCVAFVIGLVIFYLRFNYSWFAELARGEFTRRRFNTDILRASWVAELYLESKEGEKAAELPPELVTAFAQNLFRDFEWKHRVEHPAEQVLGLLGKARHVKIGELEIDRRRRPASK